VARGRVTWFSEEKGCGFIEDEEDRRGRKRAAGVEVLGQSGEECSAT
jgi:hypothetical protein